MRRSLRFVLSLLSLSIVVGYSAGAEPVKFSRTPDISPDGKTIAFSYLGDIWTVDVIGGVARPVTMHQAHEYYPIFSPDGKQIAFASNRHGGYDVFVVSTEGGKPTRLTFDSASDVPTSWTADGKNILFSSSRSNEFPSNSDIYSIPAAGGAERRVTFSEGREGVFSPRGDKLAYVRGPGSWYRKGYRGSSNDDIYICDPDGTNHRRLSVYEGQDNCPMWSPDGARVYYVSDLFGGPATIVYQDAAGKDKPALLNRNKEGKSYHTETSRRARISRNGEWIVYECAGDLWVTSTKEGSTPRRVMIEVHADDKTNPDYTKTFTNGATEFQPSPDENHVAFVVHGEIFITNIGTGKNETRRVTDHPANDHNIAWSPDGTKILFVSDRDGYDDIYVAEADDPEHPKLTGAYKFKTRRLTNTREGEFGMTFSPDGKVVTYVRGGRLYSMNPDGTNEKVLVNTQQVIDYEWSPDSKYIAYARMDGSYASEMYIMPATGGPSTNVTRYATYNSGITWSRDGKKIAFVGQRLQNNSTLLVLSLEKPAVQGTPPARELTIDWEDIHLRTKQPTSMSVREAAISPDNSTVAFSATSDNSTDIWIAASNGGDVKKLTTGNLQPRQIVWSKRNSTMFYFRDSAGQIHLSRSSPSTTGAVNTPLPFKAKMTIVRDELYTEMFDQAWRSLSDYFYDEKLHGADWEKVKSKFRPMIKHVAMKEDLYSLMYEMLGELNASHLGVSGFGSVPDEATASLGILFDERHTGRGLKVLEILKRGPADKKGLDLRPGDYILAIDRVEITPNTNVSRLLNDKVGQPIVAKVSADVNANILDPKAYRRLELQTTSTGEHSRLMYERWIDGNARQVARLSDNKFGYIHIPSMDENGLNQFVRALYSDAYDKEAIIIDVRFNGGGFTHDQVLNYLGYKEHTYFRQRHGGEGLVMRNYDRKWTKPATVMINNRSYSDAEIFPHAFRQQGHGKIVGQATGGHVIGTYQMSLIDGSSFRLPRTGVFTVKGINIEKDGVTPDVAVDITPDKIVRGQAPQLMKAVEVLKIDVAEWKKNKAATTTSRAEDPKEGVDPTRGGGGN